MFRICMATSSEEQQGDFVLGALDGTAPEGRRTAGGLRTGSPGWNSPGGKVRLIGEPQRRNVGPLWREPEERHAKGGCVIPNDTYPTAWPDEV
ncbi:hypothetical protein SKAU_G00099490 [Synaphobranchus kaupii]|uniref:Uncharacterized protein n=1 Tax=Synaphobranchus kaupii TaxID=118154 RepID=A0A9Q1FZ95_SYNKA|nr:hypothetical protein SKAU_G00099490 [Synaphobranchus kaupii]